MISLQDARNTILQRATPLGTTDAPLLDALGRAMSEDLYACLDGPPFSSSAVDGYGLRIADIPRTVPFRLRLEGSIAAGDSTSAWQPGQAVRILTGAKVPDEMDAVVMQEECTVCADEVEFRELPQGDQHIRRKGEEYKTGDLLLAAGSIIDPGVVALHASQGLSSCRTYRMPSVGILSTGNELNSTGEPLRDGCIYDSNGVSLLAAISRLGISHPAHSTSTDDPHQLADHLGQYVSDFEVVITTGGVSVGDCDLVKTILHDLGVKQEFWGVNIRPGKPFFFGTSGSKLVFGLPGNPVSALVCYFVFVRPAILSLMGHRSKNLFGRLARLRHAVERETPRSELVRGRLHYDDEKLLVQPLNKRGSHMISSLSDADCLIHFPDDVSNFAAGDLVEVIPLTW